jgi:hypothetical protein
MMSRSRSDSGSFAKITAREMMSEMAVGDSDDVSAAL